MTTTTKIYKSDGGDKMTVASGGTLNLQTGAVIREDSLVRNVRTRVTVAQANAGHTLVAAASGYKHRMVDCKITAIGGAAGAVTTVDIIGTQTTPVLLVAYTRANLTQNTLLNLGDTGVTVLAAGASFVANDANTAITIGKTGSSITTATHFDVVLSYVTETA